ncbi:MAG: hypothetical protein BWY22_01047 [Bacteroidetes bacterium ADurb.Bin217]|nr:MAG: hypothetical protein BWY22_01047 [Bacteroidetes bacterium ADurb.Bin217]
MVFRVLLAIEKLALSIPPAAKLYVNVFAASGSVDVKVANVVPDARFSLITEAERVRFVGGWFALETLILFKLKPPLINCIFKMCKPCGIEYIDSIS